MCDALVWSFDAITSINWFEVIKTAAAAATVGIAFFALRNWQRQDKAKREADFLDGLLDSAFAYIAEMAEPISYLKFTKIAVTGHMREWEAGTEEEKADRAAVAYIKNMGQADGKRMLEALERVKPSIIKLKSLAAKGQVFKFNGYAKCFNSVTMLTWQAERIQALAVMIAQPTLNWENPEVLRVLRKVLEIEAEDVQKGVNENNTALLEFVRETYARIYGFGKRPRNFGFWRRVEARGREIFSRGKRSANTE